MKKIILSLIIAAALGGSFGNGSSGCDAVATRDLGVFVPNVKGTYDLLSVTEKCADQFGSVVTVEQDEKSIVVQPTSFSFTNLTGSIDDKGAITASGASTFGAPFACTGQFASDSISGVCTSSVHVCVTDADGVETCADEAISCGFSYQRE